ncbi:MAG: diacylglycerol kinase family protein [Clostridia bacterium]|nr:diacylglycerol kinase family protein [Clostridia bacterium]
MTYILYNPQSGNKKSKDEVEKLLKLNGNLGVVADITSFDDKTDFFSSLNENECIIVCGGDGTLNHFINTHYSESIKADIFYFPSGSGNDFAKDINQSDCSAPIPIKKYLKNLPTVTVKGKTYSFLNNVGFGIDGYCCEMGDIQKHKNTRAINYTTIAIRGLLFDFKPRNATVTVDGITKNYKKVWLVPTFNGRYFGGGMMATPNQKRIDTDKNLSILIFHSSGKLITLLLFPKIFKGTHIKHKKRVEIIKGKEITVTFDRPTTLQIDGETITGVTAYTARI